MDPLSHLIATRLLLGSRPADLVAGLAPDLPWYLLYPAWLRRSGQARRALQTGDWPMPPAWIREAHYAGHSLLPLVLLWSLSKFLGRDTRWLRAWLLHLVLDIPTHSRERMAPQPFYPLARWSFDGISWADHLTQALLAVIRPRTKAPDRGESIT